MSAKIDFGQSAVDYIRTKLIRWGGMWQYLSERDLASGCVFAYFPRVPTDLDSLSLDEGLFNMEERQRQEGDWTSREKTHSLAQSYLANGTDSLALLHKPSLRSGRSYPFSAPSPIGYALQATGAEDKPLLGSKLSADSGAKTRLGPVLS